MSNPTRTLFALDPQSQKVRLVLQVTPDGWDDGELEAVLAGLIPVLGHAGIKVALLVSQETSFLLRKDDNENHYDIDEVETSEVVAPHPLDRDASKLFDNVERWVRQVASAWQDFVPQTTLPKRIPEIVPLIAGGKIRARDGAIGVPEDLVVMPVERVDG